MIPSIVRRVRPVVLAVVLACACAPPASAQYFGRNKVQYKDLNFQVLKTEHFDIYFYPNEREGVDIAARMAERWHARLQKLLGHDLNGRQPLVLYASHPDFEQTNAISGEIGEGTGGVTESIRRRIVLPMGGPLADTDHVIGHELVHAFQFDITTRPDAAPGETGAHHLPLWFIEGMAEYLSIGPVDAHTAMWLRDAARQEKLPEIKDLDNAKYFPYRWGQAFWSYVGGRYGDNVIGEMLVEGGSAGDPEAAIERVLGITAKELSEQWHQSIRDTYRTILNTAKPPNEIGRVVLKGSGGLGGDLNVGPAISPDGKWIAFLSERTGLSIDLFVADAATGRVLRKLTSTATDPHFSSLQFIYSAGAWDAESRRIAIATVASGRPALAIFDAQSGKKEREVAIATVDEIFNPTWAPDGSAVAFTGMSRGLTDLFVIDLASGNVRQLTNDPYADLQPAWSPDGRRIAFTTDRFTSELKTLDIGDYRLAVIDPASGRIEPVEAFTRGKNINPQWAPDSRALFFISDRDGISNVYRVTLGGNPSQVTTISTGVSGITASSPALSVASRTGTAVFSVYDNGDYHVYAVEGSALAGTPPAAGDARTSGAILPPADRQPSDVAALLENESFGLPAPQEYEVADYKPRLSLDAIGQPTIAVGADRFGAAIGGGMGFFFSDMLGDQSLATAIQLSTLGGNFSFKNTAAQVAYLNQANRWNWGLVAGQVPYLSGGVQAGIDTINGQRAYVEQTIIFRQTDRSAAGLVAYPFSRAQRVEFQGGVSQVSFDQVVQTEAYSLNSGALIYRNTDTQSLASNLSLATSSAALVSDTSIFGATSPVGGQRYRLEAAPTFGNVNFTSILTDYRRYFMPLSFYTFAGRVLHYGRYGSGGEDERLFPLYIGYPSLVRGYDVNTLSASECVPTAASTCPAFDRLIGSRLLVGNLEFRFPLLRPFGMSRSMYGPLPVEVALFADGGVAWSRGGKPELFGGNAQGIASTGVAFRVNLMGFAVGEFDFARPLQRPGRGWIFQFHLSPGF